MKREKHPIGVIYFVSHPGITLILIGRSAYKAYLLIWCLSVCILLFDDLKSPQCLNSYEENNVVKILVLASWWHQRSKGILHRAIIWHIPILIFPYPAPDIYRFVSTHLQPHNTYSSIPISNPSHIPILIYSSSALNIYAFFYPPLSPAMYLFLSTHLQPQTSIDSSLLFSSPRHIPINIYILNVAGLDEAIIPSYLHFWMQNIELSRGLSRAPRWSNVNVNQ